MMSGKQKLYFLLNGIDDARTITPSGESLKIHATHDLKNNYRGIELDQLFTKLEKDEQVLKILKVGNRLLEAGSRYGLNEPDDGCWHIELLPAFDKYYLKIQHEPEYQEFTGKTPSKPLDEDEAVQEPVFRKAIFALPTYSNRTRQIADQFSPENRQFVLMILKEICSLDELSPDGNIYLEPFEQGNIKANALLQKLEKEGLFLYHRGNWVSRGIAKLDNLNITLIKEVIGRLEQRQSGVITSEEFEELKNESSNHNQKSEVNEQEQKDISTWQDDFEWQGKKFVFGQYGSTITFNSKTRLQLFRELTNAKGNWVKVKDLKRILDKDESYIRPTIGQIERSFEQNIRNYISIPSTEEDDLQPKPQQGAYRIKFTTKSS